MNFVIVLIFSTFWLHYAFATEEQMNYEERNEKFSTGTNASTNLHFERKNLAPLECEFTSGLIVGSRARELECCNELANLYHLHWATNDIPLTTFLETLRQWNCPQYEEQCANRVFAFTTFSKLVYDYFCNSTSVIETCFSQVNATVSTILKRYRYHSSLNSNFTTMNLTNFLSLKKSTASSERMKWKSLVSLIRPSLLTIDELKEPCIAMAQYDNEEVHNGGYQDFTLLLLTCEPAWCGFSPEAFRAHRISFWTCLTSR